MPPLDGGLTRYGDSSTGNRLEGNVRRCVFLITVVSLVVGRPLTAQDDSLVAAGDRVRVTAGAAIVGVEGSFAGLRDDVLFLDRAGDTLRIGLDSVRLLEREIRRGFDGKKALKGAAIGGAAGAALAVWGLSDCAWGDRGIAGECHDQTAGESVLFFTAMTSAGALLGGALGGGGRSARRGGLMGFAVGAAVGAVAGLATYKSVDCGRESFICLDFGPGFNAAAGAAVGGTVVGFVGVMAGALSGNAEWESVSATDVRIGIVPAPGGLGLAGSFTF